MAGLWEDVKLTGRRVVEAAQERAGVQVVRRDELERITEAAVDGAVYRKELEYVGWTILNHVGGQGHEVKAETRKILALKSLNAFISDPMAGRIVEHYVSFVLGRGVPKPQARDAEVQQKIDEAWKDRANRRHLTSQKALVEKARAFVIQSNLYFLYFDDGLDGRVRMSSAKFDTVDDVYRHPDERARILYYVAREKRRKWDPALAAEVDEDPNSPPKVVYYEALDGFDPDDPIEVQMDEGLWTPPPGQMKPGRLLHLSTNKTDEMAFGVPQFKRLLRWFTAYNEVLESYVDRMKAAARLYMQANVTGGKSAVERAGLMAVRRAGGMGMPPPVEGDGESAAGGVGPGRMGVVVGNEGLKYEPFKIDSGASDVAAAAPIMRGQIAAGGGFPGWFMGGDPGSLAGSQSVELPVLKFIELEQELWSQPFRTLADETIRRAVEQGFLDEWRAPTDSETQAIAAGTYEGERDDRGRVKRDLTYDFSLPSPLQRAMGDFVGAAVQTATAVDPNGDFPELSRWLFGFILAEAFDVADPQKIVDEVLPLERIQEMQARQQEMSELGLEGARAAAAGMDPNLETVTGADGKQHPAGNANGAKQKSTPPEQRTQQAAMPGRLGEARKRAAGRVRGMEGDWAELERAVFAQSERLAAAGANGHGPQGE